MSNYCGFAFLVTILVIITSIDSKSAMGAEFTFPQQSLAQNPLQKTKTEGVFNSEPMIEEKKSESPKSSADSDFYNLFTPILCTLLGYVAGSVIASKSKREKVQ